MSINGFWNSGKLEDWQGALAHYDEVLEKRTEEARKLDEYVVNLNSDEIRALPEMEFYSFLHDKYFVWKYTAKNRLATCRKQLKRYVDECRLDDLTDIQKRLFVADKTNIEDCLLIAKEIHGLGPAGASGLLAVLFPKDFGTVDKFTVEALQSVNGLIYSEKVQKINPIYLRIKDVVLIETIYREKAKELKKEFGVQWTPRMIDKVLWAIEK